LLPDNSEFVDAPAIGISNSEGVKISGKKGGKLLGNLPGDEPLKKPLDRKRAEK